MDITQQHAIEACGTCGLPEEAHQVRGEDPDALGVIAALGGPCTHYTASAAAMRYQQHLAITDNRPPTRTPGGRAGARGPICSRCAHRGHQAKDCPL